MVLGFVPLSTPLPLVPLVAATVGPEKVDHARKSQLGLTLGFPVVALIGIAPWLFKNLPLMFPIVPSPLTPDFSLLSVIIIGQGVIIIPLALWGCNYWTTQEVRARDTLCHNFDAGLVAARARICFTGLYR